MPSSIAGQSFLSRLSTTTGGGKIFKCTIQLLDDSETLQCDFKKNDMGEVLFDYVCQYLQLVEKDYFGLRFMDLNKHRYWLDLNKPILKQIHGVTPIVFCLRVRYYPSSPNVLKEEITRYQLFLQLRRDMLHGRLYCPQADGAYLGACVVQSEVGDYNADEMSDSYVSEYKLFLKQTSKMEDRVAEVHKTLTGLSPADAELRFLARGSALDTYGFDPYTVKDLRSNNSVYVGVTHQGILVYHTNRKIHHIVWDQLLKVDYVAREYRIYPRPEYFNDVLGGGQTLQDVIDNEPLNVAEVDDVETERASMGRQTPMTPAADLGNGDLVVGAEAANLTVDNHTHETPRESKQGGDKKDATSTALGTQVLKFQCPSATFAKHLWKYTLSQQAFFTSNAARAVKPVTSKPRIPLLLRGSTFRYSGRVLQEIAEEPVSPREQPSFVRYHVERQPGRDERTFPWMNKYSTLPRAKKAGRDGHDENDSSQLQHHEAPEIGRSNVDVPDMHTQCRSPDLNMSPETELAQNAFVSEVQATAPNNLMNKPTSMNNNPYPASLSSSTAHNDSSLLVGPATANQRTTLNDSSQSASSRITPLANSTPLKATQQRNGAVTASNYNNNNKRTPFITSINGNVKLLDNDPKSSTNNSSSVGWCSWCIQTLLTLMLLCLVVAVIVIAVMEVTDKSFRDNVHRVPGAVEFRHLHYEPMRRWVMQQWMQLKNRLQ